MASMRSRSRPDERREVDLFEPRHVAAPGLAGGDVEQALEHAHEPPDVAAGGKQPRLDGFGRAGLERARQLPVEMRERRADLVRELVAHVAVGLDQRSHPRQRSDAMIGEFVDLVAGHDVLSDPQLLRIARTKGAIDGLDAVA